MGAAFEIGWREPDVAEERGHAGDVELLALMRGAGQRQLLVGQVNLSIAPEVTIASACIDLMAERGKTGRSMSPAEAMTVPAASMTTKAPRWRFSTQLPRVGFGENGIGVHHKEIGLRDALVGHQEAGKVNRRREEGTLHGIGFGDRVGETQTLSARRRVENRVATARRAGRGSSCRTTARSRAGWRTPRRRR